MVILSCSAQRLQYRLPSFWHWCFQARLPYHVQRPFILSRMHRWHWPACASHCLPHVWTFLSVHRCAQCVPRAPCSSQCWDRARWQQLPLSFWDLKEMVVSNADVVINYELQKLYAVIFCDSEVIPSLALRHLVEQPRGQTTFGFSSHAGECLALQFPARLQLSCVTDKIQVGQTHREITYFILNCSSMWKVKREIIT